MIEFDLNLDGASTVAEGTELHYKLQYHLEEGDQVISDGRYELGILAGYYDEDSYNLMMLDTGQKDEDGYSKNLIGAFLGCNQGTTLIDIDEGNYLEIKCFVDPSIS